MVGEETLNQINSDALGTTALQIETSLVCYNMDLNMSLQCIRNPFTQCNGCAVEIHGSLLSKILNLESVCGHACYWISPLVHLAQNTALTVANQMPPEKSKSKTKSLAISYLCSIESDTIGLLPLLPFI